MTTGPPYIPAYPPAGVDANPRPKKRRRRQLAPEPPKGVYAAEVFPEAVVSSLMDRSAAKICESVGYVGITAGAQARLRQLMENYYLHMLQTVNLFALAQRRTRPVALDFEDMLQQHHISLADLEDEVNRMPPIPPAPLPPLSPPPPPDPDLSILLGPELDGARDRRSYIPTHLPPFPSRHTYQSTPMFSERPTDPRLIRERATAEARLAEEALRKLLAVSASKKDAAQDDQDRLGMKKKARHMEWRKAFESLVNQPKVNGVYSADVQPMGGATSGGHDKQKEDDGYLEVVANWDSQFRRKGEGLPKRRPTA